MYAIKEGYVEREVPAYFPDESPILHQPDVYEHARQLVIDLGLSAIVDVGCGRAGKAAARSDKRRSTLKRRKNRGKIAGLVLHVLIGGLLISTGRKNSSGRSRPKPW